MFKKSRRKIIAAIMSVLVCLFLGTLAVIYIFSYHEVSNVNFDMLEHHAKMYVLRDHMDENQFHSLPHEWMEPLPGAVPGKPFENEPSSRLSTFYSVAVTSEGQIIATDIGGRETYDDITLEKYALDILESGNKRGLKGNLVYLVEQKNGYILVAFMDNTVIRFLHYCTVCFSDF